MCEKDHELIELMKLMFVSGNSSSNTFDHCSPDNNGSLDDLPHDDEMLNLIQAGSRNRTYGGKDFYAFATPFIIAIGLTGNIISLKVFTSTRLRKLSASLYLIALSASDTIVLLTYVLFDWLMKGLPRWPMGHQIDIVNINGVCHGFLFISYAFRFISVYLIIIFTIERYIAVCRPLQRRIICTKAFAKKIIVIVHVTGTLISIYKPILSGVFSLSAASKQPNSQNTQFYNNGNANTIIVDTPSWTIGSAGKICMRNPAYDQLNFVMELLYGLSITAIPFVVVAAFNFLMLRKLVNRQILSGQMRAVFKESKMRIEFTITVMAVSTCFVCLNIPYFVIWTQQFLQSINPEEPDVMHQTSEYISITRTIFTLNYSINFFVYCLTGTYYRGIMRNLLHCGGKAKNPSGHHSSALTSTVGLSTHSRTTEL